MVAASCKRGDRIRLMSHTTAKPMGQRPWASPFDKSAAHKPCATIASLFDAATLGIARIIHPPITSRTACAHHPAAARTITPPNPPQSAHKHDPAPVIHTKTAVGLPRLCAGDASVRAAVPAHAHKRDATPPTRSHPPPTSNTPPQPPTPPKHPSPKLIPPR